MSNPTFPIHLTARQVRVLIEGVKLVKGNPASAPEYAAADQLQQHLEGLLCTAAEAPPQGSLWSKATGDDGHTQCRFCGEFVRDTGAADRHECADLDSRRNLVPRSYERMDDDNG